ncbi:ANR family transcriptional regulator [Vibrio parahaemolyticus]|uniref:ANR family transcriptional regulator n=1 Tax=Vibrio parahaemolyticus TaxID=670 RepID=UPI00177CD27C|nr:ANR family transcriptional regulator [Vibrio parahaemolyticus]MBD6947922.1 ANR family transcriptional regulator [Vibrio parahaemolyticus]MBD6959652.1 ANR family transcriptional regulator [Vibrio parahaemolyticus]MBD6977541.1 ANR family transcriptional regulator [Vibrio parahaemolyticus]MBD6990480.1 ANR family transcriptional regulator [Vibrio parahaemolyticus]WOZ60681.1 ANR family transcriptional regulator [Vibrio parahaemolyticus]
MATTASRNKYRIHATDAAEAERKGDYQAAACHWKTARIYAPNATESHWVSARVDFCETKSKEEVIA